MAGIVDVKKYENFFKMFMDELEMRNYLHILKESYELKMISEEEYKSELGKYLESYRKR